MNRIDRTFASGRKVFIPYITAGYPSVAETVKIMHLLVSEGADILELGYPFSDPTADGPVIQKSSQQALVNGFKRESYFRILEEFRGQDSETPVIIFSYYNPIFNMGVEAFAARAAAAGADGMLIVDVPFEEQQQVRPILDALGMHLIQLIAPTTPAARAKQIVEQASGFIYQIARRGVTGVRSDLSSDAAENAAAIKALTDLPVALGFGVSSPEQAGAIAKYADGVVVGSAIVKELSDRLPDYEEALAKLVRELAEAIHSGDA